MSDQGHHPLRLPGAAKGTSEPHRIAAAAVECLRITANWIDETAECCSQEDHRWAAGTLRQAFAALVPCVDRAAAERLLEDYPTLRDHRPGPLPPYGVESAEVRGLRLITELGAEGEPTIEIPCGSFRQSLRELILIELEVQLYFAAERWPALDRARRRLFRGRVDRA